MNKKDKQINQLQWHRVLLLLLAIFFFVCFLATAIELSQEIKELKQENNCNYILNDRIYCNSLPTGWSYTFTDLELSQEKINKICEELE